MKIWGIRIPEEGLDIQTKKYLATLPTVIPSVEWVWQEIDRIWESFSLDNSRPLSGQPIDAFYSHPVWLMNGLFTQSDPTSRGHRQSIAKYIHNLGVKLVVDYGGGLSALAQEIVHHDPQTEVVIVEPYPSALALFMLKNERRIKFVTSLSEISLPDLVIAQDVLEHLEDPVKKAFELCSLLRPGGTAIFANCFYPVIQCHLPKTFHLRFTFPHVMQAMGLAFVESISGAEHALVFRKDATLDLESARRAERVSEWIGPLLNIVRQELGRLAKWISPG
ncbi:class I SAM-dependent methyltransferase [Dissulfurirhabdus thermomarina]|uniref:Class I SAM-dependent methyltransferase n=1 Tax=Dissulfurirhabdus thermomarina TaxID=1765737 RepID=A0A6N9TRC2_DISTH|nr:class I SAM-dependent methyltransferase [Dissulfurirhabdus thermomarina]NDY42304.1 class I SAM-dependent methyltransferase [Dissulfurirhabdus thermomarina]NMX24163.1 class I SAM-dependent methyltransferase [Dissulfurirhabdus thermomarina]